MNQVVIVGKNGTLTNVQTKIEKQNLYKVCGFKSNTDFDNRTIWDVTLDKESIYVELWARNDGRANSENKYDFPPPVDNELYFGNCVLIAYNHEGYVDLTVKKWRKIYEDLFGGFEDLVSEEESEDELDDIPDEYKTKSGYLKDGFVVDDDDSNDDDEDDNVDNNDQVCDDSSTSSNECEDSDSDNDIENDELCEEDYVYSDEEETTNKK